MRKLKLQMQVTVDGYVAASTAYPCGIVVNSYLPK